MTKRKTNSGKRSRSREPAAVSPFVREAFNLLRSDWETAKRFYGVERKSVPVVWETEDGEKFTIEGVTQSYLDSRNKLTILDRLNRLCGFK